MSTPATGPGTSAGTATCAARIAQDISWRVAESADADELARWCRAVGEPVLTSPPRRSEAPPTIDQLVAVSWNAHLAEGELPRLVTALQTGALTGGTPVTHFVLLVQELYRRGDAVPPFDQGDRSAFAIRPRDAHAPDIEDHVRNLGLSFFYVPSMRNGPELREDRGNAIVSTEPLLDPMAVELPLARQRRVALAAAIEISTPRGVRPLHIVDAHLEPLSSPGTLWVFRNPRPQQVRALLHVLDEPRFTDPSSAGVIFGGDFNTVRHGAVETAYRLARTWSRSLLSEDERRTHMMGRLDYLFFNLQDGWQASTRRIDDRFGSDHHPVLGTFVREP